MTINKTEIMALEWLKEQGYKENEIIRNSNKSPDFVCLDGKRYEVKYLYKTQLIFSPIQERDLKENDIILVFNNKGFVTQFKWKDKKKSGFKINVVTQSGEVIRINTNTKIQLEDIRRIGQTFDGIIRELIEERKDKK